MVRSTAPRAHGRGRLARALAAASAALILLASSLPMVQASHSGGNPSTLHVLTAGNANINGRKDLEFVEVGDFTENGTGGATVEADLYALYEEGVTTNCPAGELFLFIKMKGNARTIDDPSLLAFRFDLDNDGSTAEQPIAPGAGQGPAYHLGRTGAEFSVCYTTIDEPAGQGISISFRFSTGGLTGENRLALLEGATTTTDVGLTVATPNAPPPAPPSGTLQVLATPIRIVDTRANLGLGSKLRGNVFRSVNVIASTSIPDNAFAITGNATVVGPTHSGFVSLLPEEFGPTEPLPISNVNFKAGETRPNNFIARLDGEGNLWVVLKGSSAASAEFLLDVTGFFVPATDQGHYNALTPARILDSRNNNGVSGIFSSGVPKSFVVRGRGGVPTATSVVAVAGNLTVTGANRPGFAALTTTEDATPATSTLNFKAGQTVANGIVIGLDAAGELSAVVGNGAGGRAHLLFDVTGYFQTGATGTIFHTIAPVRRIDTRAGLGLPGALQDGNADTLDLTPSASVPDGSVGIAGNLTVFKPTANGFVSATKDETTSPSTSTINFVAGAILANGIVAPLDDLPTAGAMSFIYRTAAAGSQTTHLLMDVTGYFAP